MALPPLSSFVGTPSKPSLSSFQRAPTATSPQTPQTPQTPSSPIPTDFFSTPAYSMGVDNKSGIVGTLGKETANIGKSALKFGKGVFDFLNPVNTAKTLMQLPSAISGYAGDVNAAKQSEQQAQTLEQKAQAVTGKKPVAPPSAPGSLSPDFVKAGIQSTIPQAVQLAFQGQGTKSLQSLAEDPFQLAPAFLMLKGALESPTGAVSETKVNEATGAPAPQTYAETPVGNAIDKTISTVAKPVIKAGEVIGKVGGKAADAVSTLAKFGTAQATGLSPKTIETITQNPEKFFGKNYGADYTREAIGNKVSTAIDQRLTDLSATGKEYQGIRTSGETVQIPTTKGIAEPIKNVLDQFGVKLDGKGNVKTDAESTPMSKTDKGALQDFIDTFGKKSELTANAFLNARKALSNMAKFDATKTDASTAMSRSLRAAYDAYGKDQVTGLKELDAKYAPETQLLKQIKKDYLKPDGSFKDNALSKIANLTNSGRENVLARLDQISPGIGKEIATLKAVEDIANTGGQKVGTYARAATTLGTYATAGLPGAIVEAILTNPKVATQLLAGFAKLKGLDISGLLGKVFTGDIPKTPDIPYDKITNAVKNFKPKIGLSIEDVSPKAEEAPKPEATSKTAPEFKNFKDLSTKILGKLEGHDVVSKQFISDLTNSGDIKQAERDVIRKTLADFPDKVPVKEFANAVKTELLPLKTSEQINPRYENISLPSDQRGNVANYQEKIYQSPIATSAGDVHFSGYGDNSSRAGTDATPNYFAHTRVEDLAKDNSTIPVNQGDHITVGDKKFGSTSDAQSYSASKGSTRRVIELQSDLFQKGNLGKEVPSYINPTDYLPKETQTELQKVSSRILDLERATNASSYTDELSQLKTQRQEILKQAEPAQAKIIADRTAETAKLEPYRNTWHERVIKEEVKQAAKDGKTKLQFPTGETAMKIEGLGNTEYWYEPKYYGDRTLNADQLKVGKQIVDKNNDGWVVTDVLGDGKFKAVPRNEYEIFQRNPQQYTPERIAGYTETFDISGKVDTNNPIYKFYEKEVGKYLKNKFGATQVTDPQGVTWNEVPIKKAQGKLPIEAYAAAPLVAGLTNRKKK